MMLPATVTQQRGVPGSIYCHGHPERPRYRARTSMSNRSKKRLKPARIGKCLGLSLTKKWHVPVLFRIGLFEGLHATASVPTVLLGSQQSGHVGSGETVA